MNEQVKKKWIAALRSGQYKQGTHKLRGTDDSYCCLGVLCDLAVKAKVISPPTIDHNVYVYGKSHNTLPAKVSEWAGVSFLGAYEGQRHLAWDNDGGATFEQIANTIESKTMIYLPQSNTKE